jgi:uncharacterized protein (DUF1919 family)
VSEAAIQEESHEFGVRPGLVSPLERVVARVQRALAFNPRLQARVTFLKRVGLRNRDFTIVSDNCWGGFVYQQFALPYRTPFIGLFLFGDCYVRLLQDFERNLAADPVMIDPERSRYVQTMIDGKSLGTYPVGVLGDGIELHFLHYQSAAAALRKWRERRARMNPGNTLFKFCDRLVDDPVLIERFFALPFKHKISFTRTRYPFKNAYCDVAFDVKRYLNAMVMAPA